MVILWLNVCPTPHYHHHQTISWMKAGTVSVHDTCAEAQQALKYLLSERNITMDKVSLSGSSQRERRFCKIGTLQNYYVTHFYWDKDTATSG